MAKLNMYRTYGDGPDKKDPIIWKVKTLLQDEGLYKDRQLLHELSGVAVATMDNWFEGDTMKPRNETVGAVISSLGYDITFTKVKDITIRDELKKAAAFLVKHGADPKRAETIKRHAEELNGHTATAKKKRGGA